MRQALPARRTSSCLHCLWSWVCGPCRESFRILFAVVGGRTLGTAAVAVGMSVGVQHVLAVAGPIACALGHGLVLAVVSTVACAPGQG